jgi:hypothetical protein
VTVRRSMRAFGQAQWIYFAHVVALLTPGTETPQHESHQIEPEALDDWSEPDRKLMIEEGRRQADRQLSGAANPMAARAALFIASLSVLGYGLAGAVAIMAGRADFKLIDTAVLSHKALPIERYLADAYSRMLREGENTVATRITIFRQSVLWLIVGGYMGLIAALV